MAALKNNGYELARFEKIKTGQNREGESETTKTVLSIRSNGKVLKKWSVKSPSFNHDWPWKHYAKHAGLDVAKTCLERAGFVQVTP